MKQLNDLRQADAMVEVTPAMVEVGIDELCEERFGGDMAYLVEKIYRAMFYASPRASEIRESR